MNCLYTALAILYVVYGTASQSSIITGDVVIQTRNGILHCDVLQCPSNTDNCHVTRQNDPRDFSQIVKRLRCVASDGNIVAEKDVYQPNTYGNYVNQNFVSGGAGRPLTPREQKELDESLRRTNEQVEETLKRVYESVRPFQDGTFEANLRNQIQTEVFDNLKNVFGD